MQHTGKSQPPRRAAPPEPRRPARARTPDASPRAGGWPLHEEGVGRAAALAWWASGGGQRGPERLQQPAGVRCRRPAGLRASARGGVTALLTERAGSRTGGGGGGRWAARASLSRAAGPPARRTTASSRRWGRASQVRPREETSLKLRKLRSFLEERAAVGARRLGARCGSRHATHLSMHRDVM